MGMLPIKRVLPDRKIEELSTETIEDILSTQNIPEQEISEYVAKEDIKRLPSDNYHHYAVFKDRKQRLYFFEEIENYQDYFIDESEVEETENLSEPKAPPRVMIDYKLQYIIQGSTVKNSNARQD